MITLYRVADCRACDEVQDTLEELVVAHKVVDVEKEPVREAVAAGAQPAASSHYPPDVARLLESGEMPVVMDGDRVISGQHALRDYLVELTREMEQWRKFQTDACYIDDEGKTC